MLSFYCFKILSSQFFFSDTISRLLKKADSLKSEVCGERGALQEWRAALERSASDIMAIEQFTKQDLSRAKVFKWFTKVVLVDI